MAMGDHDMTTTLSLLSGLHLTTLHHQQQRSQQHQHQESQLDRNPSHRPFSFSSYPASALSRTTQNHQPNPNIWQYINPCSDKAPHFLLAHCRNLDKAERVRMSYKTVMCQNWLEVGTCHFGTKCRFAHGPEELRMPRTPLPINEKYKTRFCDKYTKNGICPYGERCLFIHPEVTHIKPLTEFTAHTQPPPTPAAPSAVLPQQFQPMSTTLPRFMNQQTSTTQRSLFTTSLPPSFTNCQRRSIHHQLQSEHRRKNLFPHIEEELRREQQSEKKKFDDSPLQCSSSSSSSNHVDGERISTTDVTDELHDAGMAEMVDRLIETPSYHTKTVKMNGECVG